VGLHHQLVLLLIQQVLKLFGIDFVPDAYADIINTLLAIGVACGVLYDTGGQKIAKK
jgi:Bacteriophage holin.